MNSETLRTLTPEGLRQYLDYLETVIVRAEHFEALSISGEGQYLLANLETRKRFWQQMYRTIDLSKGHEALITAAKFQAKEEEAQFWIDQIVRHKEVKADAVAETEKISQAFTVAKKRSVKTRTSFVPTGHKLPEEKKHAANS